MIIQHNLYAMNSNRSLGITTGHQAKLTEKLSSGYRINRAADDAAGLAISEKMRRQIRGLTQASTNAQDGISLIQTAEGGLNEVHEMLQRMNELAVQASNGTLSDEDRADINAEIQALKKEINRVAGSTTFNEIQLFPSDGSSIYTESYDIHFNADGSYTSTLRDVAYTFSPPANIPSNLTETTALVEDLLQEAIVKIKANYPALNTDDGSLDIKLDMSYIDGSNGTLAYAQFSYDPRDPNTPDASSFLIKVDTADFTDENSSASAPADISRNNLLKSTLYHELTHSVMQYTLTGAMINDLPQWFIEGTAQLSGGGFATGWNTGLAMAVDDTEYPTDDDKDAAVADYLKRDTVEGRPYGHGYLAAAYIASLADGSGTVDAASLANGINKVFEKLKAGKTFEEAVSEATGKTPAQIESEINNASPAATEFVRKLAVATGDGSGSLLFDGGLSAGNQLMGALPSDGSTPSSISAADTITLQVGTEVGQTIDVNLFSIGTRSLGLDISNTLTIEASNSMIDRVKGAIEIISTIRSYYGATQNRLEHTIKNLDNVVENTTAAESRIRDTDMAKVMVDYSNTNILAQAGTAMLTQSNQMNQAVLSLLS